MTDLLTILLMASPEGEQNPITSFLPLILIVVVFYFFMIRPQMKKQKDTRKFREGISKGDQVLTLGGIYGKVAEVADTHIMLEVSKEVKLKVDKNAITADAADIAQPK